MMNKQKIVLSTTLLSLIVLLLLFLSGCSSATIDKNQVVDTSVKNNSSLVEQEINSSSISSINGCGNFANSVCGSDGKTYMNACLASAFNITVVKFSACDKDAPTPSGATFIGSAQCDNVSTAFVCGFVEGRGYKNFKNDCMAQLVQATNISEGACS